MRQAQILVIKDTTFGSITDGLLAGALPVLDNKDFLARVIEVPNLSQAPAVIRFAIRAMELRTGEDKYAGYVLLGCTPYTQQGASDELQLQTFFDGVQKLIMDYSVAVGVGVISPADEHLSKEGPNNVGTLAAQECLKMLEVKRELGL